MSDARKYSGQMKKTLFLIFVIFLSLVPKLKVINVITEVKTIDIHKPEYTSLQYTTIAYQT